MFAYKVIPVLVQGMDTSLLEPLEPVEVASLRLEDEIGRKDSVTVIGAIPNDEGGPVLSGVILVTAFHLGPDVLPGVLGFVVVLNNSHRGAGWDTQLGKISAQEHV